MALQVSSAHQHLATQFTLVGRLAFGVQSDVFVEVAGISKRSLTHFAFERLEARVRAYVDFKAVLARVPLAAEHAHVAMLGLGALFVRKLWQRRRFFL